VEAGDAHAGLVALWNAVLAGWVPPDVVTPDEYAALRSEVGDSAARAYAGFACSFGGKYFGGFARKSDGSPDQSSSRASLLRKAEAIRPVISELRCASYTAYRPANDSVVYCDPPYITAATYSTGVWRPYEFWDKARAWAADGALVLVSEFQAPSDFVVLAETTRVVSVARTSQRRERAAERVFVHASQRAAFKGN